MNSHIRLLLLTAIALLCGCGGDKPRMIRVTIQYPGASPQEVVDALAAPLEFALLGLPQVDGITSISSAGLLSTYIVIAGNSRPDEVLARIIGELPIDQLPNDAIAPSVKLLPTTATIPAVSPTDCDYIVVDLDLRAVAKHAIPMRNVISAMKEQAGGSASDLSRLAKLRAVRVIRQDDRRVPLTELAEIRIEKQPSHFVSQWPAGG